MTNMELMEAAEKVRRTNGISQLEFGELKQVVEEYVLIAKKAEMRVKELEIDFKKLENSIKELLATPVKEEAIEEVIEEVVINTPKVVVKKAAVKSKVKGDK